MLRLKDKTALITGGAGGIGRAAVTLFAEEGARVAFVDISRAEGNSIQQSLAQAGHEVTFIEADITVERDIHDAVRETVASFGGLHVLYNCAGGSADTDGVVTDVDLSLWDATMNVDLRGTFLMCRHAIPKIVASGGGSIVNMSSWTALRGRYEKHIYVAAKGGILSLTRALAAEYAHAGIRVNAICPGAISTPRIIERRAAQNNSLSARQEAHARVMSDYPFSFGEPRDIANIALFLACDESRMITGASIAADGGRSAY